MGRWTPGGGAMPTYSFVMDDSGVSTDSMADLHVLRWFGFPKRYVMLEKSRNQKTRYPSRGAALRTNRSE